MTAPFLIEAAQAAARPDFDLLCNLRGAAPGRVGVLSVRTTSTGGRIGRLFPGAVVETLDLRRPEAVPSAAREPYDLIYSEGAVDWRPALRRLLPRLAARLAPGGALAAQLPNDLYEPYRAAARLVAADGPWTQALLPVAKSRPFNATMEQLHALLRPWCASVEVWETTYLLALHGVEAIADVMREGSLAPFLAPLDPPARADFLKRYLSELRAAYPADARGDVLVRAPKIFVVARR